MVLLARTASASGFDQFEMSLTQMGPDRSEMLHSMSLMLLLEMFPLIAGIL